MKRDIEEKVEIYKALRDLVSCLDSGGLIYIGKQGEGYTDIRALVSDETMAWIRHDIIGCLNVETIAIRQEILHHGSLKKSAAEIPPEQIGIPKNDYRRCGCEVDDGK